MSSIRIFADDTPLPVLDPGRGRTKTGRLWGYAVDVRPWGGEIPPAVVYLYAEDRKGEPPGGAPGRVPGRAAGGRLRRLQEPAREPAARGDPARLLLGPLPEAVL